MDTRRGTGRRHGGGSYRGDGPPGLAHRGRPGHGPGLAAGVRGPALLDGRAEPAPRPRDLDPVRGGHVAAGRLPVHELDPALRPRQRGHLERGPRARPRAHRGGRHRRGGRAHRRRARHHAGLRADRRPLLAGPGPGEGPGRAAHPGRDAGHDPARGDRELRRGDGGDAGRPAHRGARPCHLPVRGAPVLAQLRLLLLGDEGLVLRLHHPAHLRPHGPAHARGGGRRRALHHRLRGLHDHRRPRRGRALPAHLPELMIEYRDVHKTFDVPVLAGVTFTVETGETLAVVGPSGTGKSVLLTPTIGLIVPDAGDVVIDGQSVFSADIEQLQEIRRKAGYVFQNAALFDSMNVFENVAYGLPERVLKTLGRKEVLRRVTRALEEVNLNPSVVL